MSDKEIYQDRLRDIATRLADLEIQLNNCPKDGSYERQELESEKRDLLTHRRVAERALGDLLSTAPQPNEDQRRNQRSRKAFIDAEIATRKEGTLAFIEQLERSGDHRQARLWRGELLNLRAQVEKEFPA